MQEEKYEKLVLGINVLLNSDINCLIVQGSTGIGKSEIVDRTLKNENHVLLTGYITEARFFKFLQDNNDKKVIVIRDLGHLLNSKSFMDFMKTATEIKPVRKVSRLIMRKSEQSKDTLEFKSKLIWELNSLPKWTEDFEAVKSRSLFVELCFSREEVSELMRGIAKTQLEKEITEYLVERKDILGITFNLRTQKQCFEIAKSSKNTEFKEIKHLVELFLERQYNILQKALYELCGKKSLSRKIFVRYLMSKFIWSKATCERKINDSIELEEIYKDKRWNSNLSLISPFSK